MRKTAIYLIAGGIILLVLKFITEVLQYLTSRPIIGLGIVIITVGVLLFLLDIYQENQRSKDSEPFRGVKM